MFLGDYVDRGPDSAGVVAEVRAIAKRGPAKVVALRGAYEQRLAEILKEGVAKGEFEVVDAKSGEDITRQVLTQIIVDEEARGSTLLGKFFWKAGDQTLIDGIAVNGSANTVGFIAGVVRRVQPDVAMVLQMDEVRMTKLERICF